MSKKDVRLTLVKAQTDIHISLPLAEVGVSAGFPSPAENFIERRIDLNRDLVKDPESTFFAWVDGQSMKDDGINDGDLLVIRKTPVPADGDICVCFFNGEFILKRVKKEQDKIWLLPSNKKYKPIEVRPDDELTVWGKVLASINLFVKLW